MSVLCLLAPSAARVLLLLLPQTGHPAFMYVVSELLKVFASEAAAETNMGHILTQLLRSSCERLRTLEVRSCKSQLALSVGDARGGQGLTPGGIVLRRT